MRELAPGESMCLGLSVSIPPSFQIGEVSCTLETDDPDFPSWTYSLRYQALPDARIVPSPILLATDDSQDISGDDRWLEVFTPGGGTFAGPITMDAPAEVMARIESIPGVQTIGGRATVSRHRLWISLKPE